MKLKHFLITLFFATPLLINAQDRIQNAGSQKDSWETQDGDWHTLIEVHEAGNYMVNLKDGTYEKGRIVLRANMTMTNLVTGEILTQKSVDHYHTNTRRIGDDFWVEQKQISIVRGDIINVVYHVWVTYSLVDNEFIITYDKTLQN